MQLNRVKQYPMILSAVVWAVGSWGWPVTARAEVVERVVAVVNDDILLLSRLNERLRPVLPQLQQITNSELRKQKRDQLRLQMLNLMIDEELIKQEASKLKLEVNNDDLELAIKDVMRKNNLTREQLERALQEEGSTIESYKHLILKSQLLRLRVINMQVRSRITVSDDEIKAHYQNYLRDLGVDVQVRARQIFVAFAPDATPQQIAEKKQYAVKLMAQVKGGADFAEVARKYSDDTITRDDGGDLGFFSRGNLPANVEEVVFGMKQGEIRGPLKTERGFHIIQLVKRRESSARSLDEVKEELRQQLYTSKLEKATRAWLDEVRKRSYIDIKI